MSTLSVMAVAGLVYAAIVIVVTLFEIRAHRRSQAERFQREIDDWQ